VAVLALLFAPTLARALHCHSHCVVLLCSTISRFCRKIQLPLELRAKGGGYIAGALLDGGPFGVGGDVKASVVRARGSLTLSVNVSADPAPSMDLDDAAAAAVAAAARPGAVLKLSGYMREDGVVVASARVQLLKPLPGAPSDTEFLDGLGPCLVCRAWLFRPGVYIDTDSEMAGAGEGKEED
jgi:hypothetical protein